MRARLTGRSSIGSTQSVVLHDQGAAGGVRRAAARPPGASTPATPPPSTRSTASSHGDGPAHPAGRDRRRRRAVLHRLRARAAQAPAGALRAAVARLDDRAARPGRLEGPARSRSPPRSASTTRRPRCSRSRSRSSSMLLLHFSLVISRLADQNKVLAQKLSLLQQRVEVLESGEAETARARRRAPRAPRSARCPEPGPAAAVVIVGHDSADGTARRRWARCCRSSPRRRGRRRRLRVARRHGPGRARSARRPRDRARAGREPRLRRWLQRRGGRDPRAAARAPEPRLRSPSPASWTRCARRRPGILAGAPGRRSCRCRRRREVNTDGNVVHWLGIGWAGGLHTSADGARARGDARGRLPVGRGDGRPPRGMGRGRRLRRALLHVRRGPRSRPAPTARRLGVRRGAGGGGRARLRVHQGRLQVVLARAQPRVDGARRVPGRAARGAGAGAAGLRGRAAGAGVAWGVAACEVAGAAAVLRDLPRILARRREVQATATVSASEFAAGLSDALDSPNLAAARAIRALRRCRRRTGALVRLVVRG